MSSQRARKEATLCRQLLRAALDPSLSSDPAEFDAAALAGVNWSLLLEMSRQHRLGGLLCEGVRRLELTRGIPAPVWESLQMGYYSNLAHNLVLFRHGEEIIERSARLGVPVILLKGAALAGTLYRNVALRPMADLDLLVRRSEARAMIDLVGRLGYELGEVASHATLLRHRASGTYLEVHTSLTSCPDYFGIETEDLLARSRAAAFWPVPARSLAPADHLLHLALHGSFQHAFRQAAINACDMFLLSRAPDLDWEAFFAQARVPRRAPLVYGGLELAQRLLPSESLAGALATLRPQASWLQRRSVARLSAEALLAPAAEGAPPPAWRRILWVPSLHDALALVGHTLRGPGGESSAWWRLQRGLALVSRHGLDRVLRRFRSRVPRPKAAPGIRLPGRGAPAAVGAELAAVSQGAQTDV